MRERNVTTTREAVSVADHEASALVWSPSQKHVAVLSGGPRIRLWNVSKGLKGELAWLSIGRRMLV